MVKAQAAAESATPTQGKAQQSRLPLDQVTVGAEYEGRVVRSSARAAIMAPADHRAEHRALPQQTAARTQQCTAMGDDGRSLPQVKVEQFGAFVDFGFAKQGLVHISQLSVSSTAQQGRSRS